MFNTSRRLALITLLTLPLAVAAQAPGWVGLETDVGVSGSFFNARVQTIKVKGSKPGSPAERAGLKPGELLLHIQQVVVAGAEPDAVRAVLKLNVGQTLALRVRGLDGQERTLSLVAAAKP